MGYLQMFSGSNSSLVALYKKPDDLLKSFLFKSILLLIRTARIDYKVSGLKKSYLFSYYFNTLYRSFNSASRISILSLQNTNTDANWILFRNYLLLITLGWLNASTFNPALLSDFYGILSFKKKILGKKYYGYFNINLSWHLWFNWWSFLFMSIQLGVPIFYFGPVRYQSLGSLINWSSWSFSFIEWSSLSLLFYFRFFPRSSNKLIMKNIVQVFSSCLILCVDIFFSYYFLSFLRYRRTKTIGLTSFNVEPWLVWYPLFGNGSLLSTQYFCLVNTLYLLFRAHDLTYSFYLRYIKLLVIY